MSTITVNDTDELVEKCQAVFSLTKDQATAMAEETDSIFQTKQLSINNSISIDLSDHIDHMITSKKSIPPEEELHRDTSEHCRVTNTEIVISNQTTTDSIHELLNENYKPLVLNFANGVRPGGGWLTGALAQEEALCRDSLLYYSLVGDAMYDHHLFSPTASSSDWCIYSQDVPVIRNAIGELIEPVDVSFITCAAPYALSIGVEQAASLMESRIRRVLEIARFYQHDSLILGAWGCGVFGNSPYKIAKLFKGQLDGEFNNTFSKVVFAIADVSPTRKFLRPFVEIFNEA